MAGEMIIYMPMEIVVLLRLAQVKCRATEMWKARLTRRTVLEWRKLLIDLVRP
jgi:hypothetical protein